MFNNFDFFSLSSFFGKPKQKGYYSTKGSYSKLYIPHSVRELDKLLDTYGRAEMRTEKEIRFKKLPFGTSLKEAGRQLKNLHFTDNSAVAPGYKIGVRHTKVGGLHVVSQFHFLNNKLFLGQYLLNEVKGAGLMFLKNVLAEKYLNCQQASIGEIIICDPNGNKIKLTGDNYGSIVYLTGDKTILEQLRELNKQYKEVLLRREQAKLDKFYEML